MPSRLSNQPLLDIQTVESAIIDLAATYLATTCCCLTCELSCFSKIPKYDKPPSAQDL